MSITLGEIERLVGGKVSDKSFYTTCPRCSAGRSTKAHRKAKVLRIWRRERGWAGFSCYHCGIKGCTFDPNAKLPDPIKLAEIKAASAAAARTAKAKRLSLARWLWSHKVPITGTIGETYLRAARGYGGPIPATLGFLPARGKYHPALIAPFGLGTEIEPGVLAIADAAVTGIHLTRLLPDGSGKAVFEDEDAKIMIGMSSGSPIILAPPNDLLGMAVTEGIEDALTLHEATGLGAWAAGSASRLPALADAIPGYIESVTVSVDDDPEGRRHAATLMHSIRARGIEVRPVFANRWRAAS